MEARDVFVALATLSGPEPLGPYKGLAGYAIQKTAQRFKNTPLGKLCQEALKLAEDSDYHTDYPLEPG